MTFLFFLIIILFFYFDLTLLRKSDPAVFAKVFRLSIIGWLIYGLLLLLIISLGAALKYLPAFVVVFVMPFYLYKRNQFRKQLPLGPETGYQDDPKVVLALDAFGVVLFWFLGILIFVLLLETARKVINWQGSELGQLILITTFSFVFIMVLICRAVRKYQNRDLRQILGLRRNGQSWTMLVLWPVIIGLALAAFSSWILYSRDYNPMTPLNKMLTATTSSTVFLAFIAVALLLAPLFEEMIFRGYFYYVISQTRGRMFAILFITLVFAGMHVDQYWGDWQAIAMILLLGLVMTLFRAGTGTALGSMVLHYVFNGAMTILPVLFLWSSNPSYLEYAVRFPQLDASAKEQLLAQSITMDPEHAESYNDLAWLYAEQGKNLDQALFLIDKALSISPEEYAFLDTKAEILFQLGRIDEAVDLARSLVQEYPDDQRARDQLKKFTSIRGHGL